MLHREDRPRNRRRQLFADPKPLTHPGLLRSVPKLTAIGIEKALRLETIEALFQARQICLSAAILHLDAAFEWTFALRGDPLFELPEDVRVLCVLYDRTRSLR